MLIIKRKNDSHSGFCAAFALSLPFAPDFKGSKGARCPTACGGRTCVYLPRWLPQANTCSLGEKRYPRREHSSINHGMAAS